MKKISTQVVIIGAGPSGSVAAVLLHKQGIAVKVIEKSVFPRFSIGESLLPACMEVIEKAGMTEAVNRAKFQFKDGATFRKRGIYTSFDFTDKFSTGPGTTFQVQRGTFDKVLADEASRQGVDIDYQHELKEISFTKSHAVLRVGVEGGDDYLLEAEYVLDASGFARVLPRMLQLEESSCLPPRKAIFTHVTDNIDCNSIDVEYDREKILISVHPENSDVWYWLIPFSNGTASLGVVGEPEFFEKYPTDLKEALIQIANEEPGLAEVLNKAEFTNTVGEIGGYSANVKHLATDRYALLGNAGEFLDPVFSSGVTIAMKSADIATECLVKQLSGKTVDWQTEYAQPLMVGVDTFRTYVEGWYSGELQDVIFYDDPNPKIKQMVCSILAGYAWDQTNPYVKESRRRLAALSEVCRS
ncbi:NAD(P)/FAD-dependent oxidoreductase [Vibrio profundi]|uniref:NAD(P)/FAD-dependent oxidoreductase n=1 Tax=Vibrio profundi TaxID=1774960 RepID=UPI0037351D2A